MPPSALFCAALEQEDISGAIGAHGAHIKSPSLILDLTSLVDYSIYK
jgi:hypothetical protein